MKNGLGPQNLAAAMKRVKKKKLTKAQALIRQAEAKLNVGEGAMKTQMKAYGLRIPYPILQFKFHPTRGHKFDFAWPRKSAIFANESFVGPSGFAVELDGGVHGIQEKRVRDLEKSNLAIAYGWTVFHFTPEQAEDGMVRDFLLAVFDNDRDNPSNPETVLQRKAK